jgi:hypothetical protein
MCSAETPETTNRIITLSKTLFHRKAWGLPDAPLAHLGIKTHAEALSIVRFVLFEWDRLTGEGPRGVYTDLY